MKLIVIYGPPAVGKLTVAHELAKLSDVRIFDGSPIAATVTQAIDQSNPQFIPLVYSLQLQILNAAIRYGSKDIIVTATFTASSQADIALIQTIIEACKSHNIDVKLIHLTAKKRVLLERVQQESRRIAGKIADIQTMQAFMDRNDIDTALPGTPSITINTSHLTAPEIAAQILRNISA